MKKIFSLMAAALMSLTMMAGNNDLLWDYAEGAPSGSPDHGLYFASKVTDGPGKNNGLYGIKMNGSGYAYFTKPAVAGKLKLGFGPRSGSNAEQMVVQTWTGDAASATVPTALTTIATTGAQSEYGFQIVELTAEQNNIYIKRAGTVESVLQYISFTEDVARTFVDFKIEFRDNPYTVIEPAAGLPDGVTVEGTGYNGGQHGIYGGTITVPVDGNVKFTIGGCQHSKHDITVKKDGEYYATVSNKIDLCGKTTGVYEENVPYIYMGGAGTLTFEFGSQTYVPYFFAEATEIMPCEIIFKDQTGKELGRVESYEGATLEKIPYGIEDLTPYSKSEVFRGWFYSNGKKVKLGDPINGNTTIQAKVTHIEYATVGSVQTYDFANAIFYPEDHETVEANGGSYYNNHGWYFAADGSINVEVAGNAVVVVTLCKFSESGEIKVKAGEQEIASYTLTKNETPDGTELVAKYTGEATTLTINWTTKQYIHKVTVYNVEGFVEKDENTGYIMVPSSDAASFILALVQAQSGDKIFLPNGLYDLGETVLTTISKNNIAIIGQSMEGVIIKNAPDAKTESIDKTATIKINKEVENTYLQDLTIQNALDYYKNNNGRAVCLWDQGTKTVCKNVRLLSYQDTYYSNLQGAVKYFEDCEIHGTVDFICGDGSVYFKNNLLYCEKRNANGGGQDALTANNGVASDRGYVFEGCTIKSECPTVSLGRAWNNTPTTTFLNTLVDYSAGEFSFSDGNKIQRWTKELMNANAWPRFGEYNTHLTDGTVLTPSSNEVTFVDPKNGNATQKIETVLNAEQAAAYTMEYTLGDWAATAAADATQAVCESKWSDLEADAIYMAECEGEFVMLLKGSEINKLMLYDGKTYLLRKANSRGGFGTPVEGKEETGVENVQRDQVRSMKVFRDGKIMIERDGKKYSIIGAKLQ